MAAPNSLPSALSGYLDGVARLFQLDAQLLSIETKQNLQSIVVSAAIFACAMAAAFLALVILLFAIVLLLIQLGLTPSLAAFMVAVALFAISAALASVGIGRVKRWSLTPRRTLNQFQQNIEALRASFRNEPSTSG